MEILRFYQASSLASCFRPHRPFALLVSEPDVMQQRHTAGFFVLAFFLLSNCVSTPRHALEEVSVQGAFMPQQGTPLAIEIRPREIVTLHEVDKARAEGR